MWRFDTVVEGQRQTQLRLDFQSSTLAPNFITLSEIEKDAWRIYSRSIFDIIKRSVVGTTFKCGINECVEKDGKKTYQITNKYGKKTFKVVQSLPGNHCSCSCKRFEGFGVPCMHIFLALQSSMVDKIPESLITQRWTKDVRKNAENSTLAADSQPTTYSECKQIIGDICSMLQSCVLHPALNASKLKDLAEQVKDFKKQLNNDEADDFAACRTQELETLTGISKPSKIIVKTPHLSRTKGCGSRMKTGIEKSIEQSNKRKRTCKTCGQQGHDIRNCPQNNAG
jgi:hypothetical protein